VDVPDDHGRDEAFLLLDKKKKNALVLITAFQGGKNGRCLLAGE